jgi:hypothetical protein
MVIDAIHLEIQCDKPSVMNNTAFLLQSWSLQQTYYCIMTLDDEHLNGTFMEIESIEECVCRDAISSSVHI